jgi:hypothetical protein
MSTTTIRRIGGIAIAAAISLAGGFASSQASAEARHQDTSSARPCFMIRSHWNSADGPQPTCPTPAWQSESPRVSWRLG